MYLPIPSDYVNRSHHSPVRLPDKPIAEMPIVAAIHFT